MRVTEFSFEPHYGREKYIFVSYCDEDEAFVYRFMENLHQEGFRLQWSREGNFDTALAESISGCAVFMALISEGWLLSDKCRNEVYCALKNHVDILSVYIEDITLKDGLGMRLGYYESTHPYCHENQDKYYAGLYNRECLACCKGKKPHTKNFTLLETEAAEYEADAGELFSQGKYEQAYKLYSKALEIRRDTVGGNNLLTAFDLRHIGEVMYYSRDYEKAMEYYRAALDIRLKNLGKMDLDTAESYHDMAAVYAACCDYAEAEKYFNKALSVKKKLLGDLNREVAVLYDELGDLLGDASENGKALKAYTAAFDIFTETKQTDSARAVGDKIDGINDILK